MRILGSLISKVNVKAAVIPLFIQGYLELVICGILSAKKIQTIDFTGGNASDLFSVLFLIFCLIILGCAPLLYFTTIWKNDLDLDNPEI